MRILSRAHVYALRISSKSMGIHSYLSLSSLSLYPLPLSPLHFPSPSLPPGAHPTAVSNLAVESAEEYRHRDMERERPGRTFLIHLHRASSVDSPSPPPKLQLGASGDAYNRSPLPLLPLTHIYRYTCSSKIARSKLRSADFLLSLHYTTTSTTPLYRGQG